MHVESRLAAGQQGDTDTATALFELVTLGPFRLSGPQGVIDLGSKKQCALLAYIACATPAAPRETLTTLLWGSHFEVQAKQNLRQALSRLRRAVGDDVLITNDDTVAVRTGIFQCDAQRFESLIRTATPAALRQAVGLYQGAFLTNIAIPQEAWTDWVNGQRLRLENLAVNALILLGEEEVKQAQPTRALELAQRAIAIDSLREDGHRLIMQSLAAMGQRAAALKHYEQLAARLKRDLNVEPDAATAALNADLRQPRSAQQEHKAPAGQTDMLLQTRPAESTSTARAESPPEAFMGDSAPLFVPLHQSARETLPSIAVLPFQNLGGDPADDYFADGIVEDIVVSLANLQELLVISRASTLTYRGRQADPREIGQSFGVRYVLGGTVRKGAQTVRVTTQLCDTDTGANLWGESREVPLGELFEVQDRIVRDVVGGIAPNIRVAELERALRTRPVSFTAYDYTLHALNIINSLDRETFHSARDYLDKAMAEHPGFAMPVAWAARWHSIRIGQGWSDSPGDDAAKAAGLATKAIELDGRNALALATYGHVRSFLMHDYQSALVYFERALSACPNSSLAWILSSGTLSYVGRGRDAVRHAEHALRLSPYDRNLFQYYSFLSLAHYSNGTYEDAVKWGRMSTAENASYTANYRTLAAALVALNRLDEARDVALAHMRLEPEFTLDSYYRTRQPFEHPEIKARYEAHLRRAGFPER
ncbi:MAG TPA: BTAD domain-containing putative transcriptional regulator [Vineibacter sp.]|nr:BTAD domain-containing putative transcriptional regulator [Vineibacter sp.]